MDEDIIPAYGDEEAHRQEQQDTLLAMLTEADLRQLGANDADQLLVLQSLHRRIEALEAQVRNLRATRPRTIHESAPGFHPVMGMR